MTIAEAQRILRRTLKLARRSGLRGLRWGCVVRSSISDDGVQCFSVTTSGGERLLLTRVALRAVWTQVFFLQGRTLTVIRVASCDVEKELVTAIDLDCCHMPYPSPDCDSVTLLTHSRYAWGPSRPPLILLAASRPPGWPP